MQKDKLNLLTQMVDENKVSTDLLISCLANLEPRISKSAYMRAKFKNSNMTSNECYEHEMKKYMGYRALITDILIKIYPKHKIKDIVSQIDKDKIVTNKLCDLVIELIQSGDYQLL